ncbi:MAG TPA: HEAT repeat domain-containing protein [Edaphobacter sp.]
MSPWLLVALLAPSLCRAQVTGTFALEKTTFAPGEPVFLSLTLHNAGKEPKEVMAADPYTFCSGYKIHITRDANPQPACFQGYGGSCMSGVLSLAPGASHTERLLLNYRNTSQGEFGDPVDIAGDYTVDSSREIAYAAADKYSTIFATPDHSEAHQVFHLRVDDALELSPAVYAPYVQQLNSGDEQIRREAARTLATFAPPALEPLLLTFATSKDYVLKQFAPLALANLSTKASLAALAHMLLDTNPGTYEFMKAAEYLGKTHDPAWFPLLLEVADQHGAMYLFYAAESGGDTAIPALLARLHTSDANTRSAAINALGNTGSRAVVPLLISLLDPQAKDEDGRNNSISAMVALRKLTHVYAEQDPDGTSIPNLRNRWQSWWLNFGPTVTIYKPDACVADTKLP